MGSWARLFHLDQILIINGRFEGRPTIRVSDLSRCNAERKLSIRELKSWILRAVATYSAQILMSLRFSP